MSHVWGEVGFLCWLLIQSVNCSKREIMTSATAEHLFLPDNQLPVCSYISVKQQAKQKQKKAWMRNKQTHTRTNKLGLPNPLISSSQPFEPSGYSTKLPRKFSFAVLWMSTVHKEYRLLGRDAVLSGVIVSHYKDNCFLHLPLFPFAGYRQRSWSFFFYLLSASVCKCRSSVCVWSKDIRGLFFSTSDGL